MMDDCSAIPSCAVVVMAGKLGWGFCDSSAIQTNRPRDDVAFATISLDDRAITRSLEHADAARTMAAASAYLFAFRTFDTVCAVKNIAEDASLVSGVIQYPMAQYDALNGCQYCAGRQIGH